MKKAVIMFRVRNHNNDVIDEGKLEEFDSNAEAEQELQFYDCLIGDNRVIYPLSEPNCEIWIQHNN